jgi:hypothetical protein
MPYQLLAAPSLDTPTTIAARSVDLGQSWRNHRGTVDWAAIGEDLGVELNGPAPIVLNLGAGVDSTAILIRLYELRIRPDVIVFAWVGRDSSGDEWPETYDHLITLSAWCQERGFPAVSVVNYVHQQGRYAGLYEKMLRNRIYNSSNFGRHSCSASAKGELIDRWLKVHLRAQLATGPVVRIIGFEADESERVDRMEKMFTASSRARKPVQLTMFEPPAGMKATRPCNAGSFAVTNRTDAAWLWSFPMHAWGMTRLQAERLCFDALGYRVRKSACYHCGFGKQADFLRLAFRWPFLASRLIDAELLVAAGGKVKELDRGLLGKAMKGGERRKKRPTDTTTDKTFRYHPDLDRWISEPKSGRVVDLYRRHNLIELIESVRPTFLSLGIPADHEWETLHDLDARALTARTLSKLSALPSSDAATPPRKPAKPFDPLVDRPVQVARLHPISRARSCNTKCCATEAPSWLSLFHP